MNFTLALLQFVASLGVLILSLGIVWQSERDLDKAFKFFIASAVVIVIKQIMKVLDTLGATSFAPYQDYLAVVSLLFLLLFLIRMNSALNLTASRKRK